MMTVQTPKSVALIAGPTASGKSAFALELAKNRNGVIINADASQVYQELCILSARPSERETSEVSHMLYGHRSGQNDYSVGQWLDEAKTSIEKVWSEGKLPVIVGGTGLYFMALEKGLAKIPPIDPAIREKWRNFAGDLHLELAHRDQESANRLNAADRQRLIRALEVVESTGISLIKWQEDAKHETILNGAKVERIFKILPREELYERAERRFELMLGQGALEEVRALPNLDANQPIMKAIGVPELLRYTKNEISLEEASLLAKTATRQYIKRQLTWFRGQMKDWQ